MKLPYIKFYVRDWISDAQLRMVSLAARGLWIECLCIMQMSARRGYLETINGVPLTDEMLARLTGTFKDDLYTCKKELLDNGIPSIEENTGVWYCRRMVKECEKSIKCSEAGKNGGGNPALKIVDDKKPETRNHISIKVPFKGDFEDFWKSCPYKIGKPKAKAAYEKALKKTDHATIMAGLEKHKKSDGWIKDNGQFIPHPTTWLNREGWNDDVKQFSASSNHTDYAKAAYDAELARQRARGGLPFDDNPQSKPKEKQDAYRLFHWPACDGSCKHWNKERLWCDKGVKKQPVKAEECKEFENTNTVAERR